MQKLSKTILFASSIAVTATLATYGQVTGNLGTSGQSYGSALAVQGNPTGFGDSTVGDGTSAGGSELDAAYGVISGGNLNLFLSGNVEINTGSSGNANHWNIFIQGVGTGQSTLNIASSTEAAMNGSKFSPGFTPTLMLDANNYAGTLYVDKVDLTTGPPATQSYLGGITSPGGIGSATIGGITVGYNNTNAGGITGSSATSAQALSVQTGLELQIPLSALGNQSGPIMVMADINGGNDGYMSNQILPGLPSGTSNLGSGGPYSAALNTGNGNYQGFDFSGTPGVYFTVVPEPSTIGLVVVGLLGALAIRRRKA
jgi:hypothetical protein